METKLESPAISPSEQTKLIAELSQVIIELKKANAQLHATIKVVFLHDNIALIPIEEKDDWYVGMSIYDPKRRKIGRVYAGPDPYKIRFDDEPEAENWFDSIKSCYRVLNDPAEQKFIYDAAKKISATKTRSERLFHDAEDDVEKLIKVLIDQEITWEYRRKVIEKLGDAGDKRAIESLHNVVSELLLDQNEEVRYAVGYQTLMPALKKLNSPVQYPFNKWLRVDNWKEIY